jgi:hypothetical protein
MKQMSSGFQRYHHALKGEQRILHMLQNGPGKDYVEGLAFVEKTFGTGFFTILSFDPRESAFILKVGSLQHSGNTGVTFCQFAVDGGLPNWIPICVESVYQLNGVATTVQQK